MKARLALLKGQTPKKGAPWYAPRAPRASGPVAAYRDSIGDWRSMHPDFVFFNRIDDVVRPSIVDPHGHHLGDSFVKLQGLADFAERYGDAFHRIDATLKDGTTWQVLDLKSAAVRAAVRNHTGDILALYKTPVAVRYE